MAFSTMLTMASELEPVKIKHSFPICDWRSVQVDYDNDVSIVDHNENRKRAFFNAQRWIKFRQEIPGIDKAVERAMTYKPTNFQVHIGDKWYVAVSERFQNVDIRRWFIGFDNITRPTTSGISLSFVQWSNLKKVVVQMDEQLPQFATILPCLHDGQFETEMCSECNPTADLFE